MEFYSNFSIGKIAVQQKIKITLAPVAGGGGFNGIRSLLYRPFRPLTASQNMVSYAVEGALYIIRRELLGIIAPGSLVFAIGKRH